MEQDYYEEMLKTQNSNWWFIGRRNIIHSQIEKLNLKDNSEILEAGCGTGGNLELLAEFGNVSAFEMNEYALVASKKISGKLMSKINNSIELASGYCPDNIPFKEKKFDLICMLDVIEHIEEDDVTLLNLKSKLNNNGYILLTVPAYNWLWSKHDEINHHKRRYSKNSIKKLIQDKDMKLVKISYFNSFLFPIAAIVRFLNLEMNVKKKEVKNNRSIINITINWVLSKIFSFERYLLKIFNFPFGLSIIVILKNNS